MVQLEVTTAESAVDREKYLCQVIRKKYSKLGSRYGPADHRKKWATSLRLDRGRCVFKPTDWKGSGCSRSGGQRMKRFFRGLLSMIRLLSKDYYRQPSAANCNPLQQTATNANISPRHVAAEEYQVRFKFWSCPIWNDGQLWGGLELLINVRSPPSGRR